MEEAKVTFNFIGATASSIPTNIPDALKFRAGFTPNDGDVISFEGLPGAFLIHSREFQIRSDGVVDVVLNVDVAQPAKG
ncbi:hypothetical protein UXJ26_06105 [Burkholderia multivorans]|uniref:Bacteriophage protein n=1 Tax=Burkholderia multivorans (strain ATCC 17616 / 249) TaxID=395019 RepID=A0A0H3KVX3_BURM1|nr:hypothetical protein [Burkholderia multivorans]YP_355350.1 gp15 [Burkholderia phage Bcep176]ABA60016.1 gp15 [Burkholderia phage Bcep176]ABX17534.1 hypothetical protein Bmul_3851 [Burkholderia multivorans ATCC 17616]PRF62439.1 hypothetical protein C6Q28_10710 [Burkholderia multivorans]BAG46504.1 bacteriophage protein [Burkholderia multivorans ATCC 17616]